MLEPGNQCAIWTTSTASVMVTAMMLAMATASVPALATGDATFMVPAMATVRVRLGAAHPLSRAPR